MNQKGFSTILILVGMLLVAGVLIGGGYYIGTLKNKLQTQNPVATSQTPQLTPSSSPNETANWKTYTNQENNFLFKYPSNWNIDESYKSVNGSIHFFKAGDKVRYTYMQAKGSEQLIVSVQTDQSFDELQKQLNISNSFTTIAGKKALKYVTGAYILLGPSDKKILSIYSPQYPDGTILDQILPTFKFTQ